MQEIWKDIPNYENLYLASNLGRIKSISNPKRIKILKPSISNGGYQKIQLYKGGKCKTLYVHRLIALTFIPNPNNKEEVNHIDGNKFNNNANNLEWVSRSENQLHAIKTGLREPSPMTGRKGELNPLSKEILQYSLDGALIKKWKGISNVCRTLDFKSPSSISNCLSGRYKTAYGYIWKYL